jgi:hypothetical protein
LYPFVFVSFTLHDITRPPFTATITTRFVRVLEDRTRSVFDMETRFSPFPNHVNALSGTTLRRPFFYCPTVRHYYTIMYRYNAAGIVPPNRYCHTTTAYEDEDDDDILLEQLLFSNFLFTNRSLFIASACIDRATYRYGMSAARSFIASSRAPVQS